MLFYKMKKNIITFNDKGQRHGYSKTYFGDSSWSRGNYKNGDKIGYFEVHKFKTYFYIK